MTFSRFTTALVGATLATTLALPAFAQSQTTACKAAVMEERKDIVQSNLADEDEQRLLLDNHDAYWKCINDGFVSSTPAMAVSRLDG